MVANDAILKSAAEHIRRLNSRLKQAEMERNFAVLALAVSATAALTLRLLPRK